MILVFRVFPKNDGPPPAGELHVRHNPAQDGSEPGLAALVLKHGLNALLKRDEPIEQIVIDIGFVAPTLDDMLAASFAWLLLEPEQKMPPGCQLTLPELLERCRPFAMYAAVVRQGHNPDKDVALEDSVQGIYQAILNARGTFGKSADLNIPDVAERFQEDWAKMESCILKAAAEGTNPTVKSPFANHPDFTGERAFLLHDREVYRADVLRGESWRVRLPGAPPLGWGLFLRRPRSLLFWIWCRRNHEAPAGTHHALLAVDWGNGKWVFSTDPAQRLPIDPLAALLQAEEARQIGRASPEPQKSAADQWYDGHRPEHKGTLVAAPMSGTKLSERQVLRVVKKWAQARRITPPNPRVKPAVALAAVLLFALLSTAAVVRFLAPLPKTVDIRVEGAKKTAVYVNLLEKNTWQLPPRSGHDQNKKKPDLKPVRVAWNELGGSFSANLKVILEADDMVSFPSEGFELKVNGVEAKFDKPNSSGKKFVFLAKGLDFGRNDDDATITASNPGSAEFNFELTVECAPPNRTQHVLAVGVTKYELLIPSLECPLHDAEDLAEELKKHEGKLFDKVQVERLTEPKTTREEIYKALGRLRTSCTKFDQAVVLLSGHGDLRRGSYYFAPRDYDPDNPVLHGLRASDFINEVCGLPCEVILILDTCHSGGAIDFRLLDEVQGTLIFAAALPNEEASGGKKEWGNRSALTLAVLEGIKGHRLADDSHKNEPVYSGEHTTEFISWHDLQDYVTRRMPQLVGRKQRFNHFASPDTRCEQIPIAPPPERR